MTDKIILDERDRHRFLHRRGQTVVQFKYWATSADGNWETLICQICGAAVTIPVGK